MGARGVAFLALAAPIALAGCAGDERATLTVSPADAVLDAPLIVHVRGAWHAATLFARTRQDATPLLARMVPSGYRGRGEDLSFVLQRRTVVRVELVEGARTLAAVEAVRRTRDSGVAVLDVRANGLVGRYCVGPRRKGPAIVRLGGSEGGLPDVVTCTLLASHGHATLDLAYFGAPGLPDRLVEIPLEYFARAVVWLRREAGPSSKVVFMGHSRGGEAALLVGAHYPRLVSGVVAYVPSAFAHSAPPPADGRAAWTFRGRPLPFVNPARPDGDAAAIEVERIGGPVFAVGAGQDLLWPSLGFVQEIESRMHEHGRDDITVLGYLDAGHGVGAALPNVRLATEFGERRLGGSSAADARARADAWRKLLAFLREV